LIPDGHQFVETDVRQRTNLGHVSIPQERDVL